ncbi:MAG: hypothetical protein SGJ19_23940 [Planctomycetia bacterium]|nr:hypothetical protein [Planctomycetia bacterium]
MAGQVVLPAARKDEAEQQREWYRTKAFQLTRLSDTAPDGAPGHFWVHGDADIQVNVRSKSSPPQFDSEAAKALPVELELRATVHGSGKLWDKYREITVKFERETKLRKAATAC